MGGKVQYDEWLKLRITSDQLKRLEKTAGEGNVGPWVRDAIEEKLRRAGSRATVLPPVPRLR